MRLRQLRLANNSHIARQLVSDLQDHMLKYGYEPVETPLIEPAELFLTKAGDQLATRLFTFERHGQQLALRPEFTASAAYRYIDYNSSHIVRWQFAGPTFVDDPQDYNHRYQRASIGAEILGMSGPVAEAEIIAMATQGIKSRNIDRWQLVIGHVGLLRRLLSHFQLDSRTERFLLTYRAALKDPELGKAFVLKRIDKALLSLQDPIDATGLYTGEFDSSAELSTQHILDVLLNAGERGGTMGGRTREDIARRLLQKRKRNAKREQIVAAVNFLEAWGAINDSPDQAFRIIESFIVEDDTEAHHLLLQWREVIYALKSYQIPMNRVKIQPELARSWDYYTGIVFELKTESGLDLGGGGRYDELARLVGGQRDVPAVGFAYYVDEMLAALPSSSEDKEHTVFVIITPDTHYAGVTWAQRLRYHNIRTIVVPADDMSETDVVLFVQENGSARLGESVYSIEQGDSLIKHLKQAYNL